MGDFYNIFPDGASYLSSSSPAARQADNPPTPQKEILMKNFVLAALAIPALIGTVHCDRCHPSHHDLHAMIIRKLDLTSSQKDAAHAVIVAHHPVLKAEFDAALKARMDLAQLVTDPQATPEQIRELDAKANAALLTLELDLNQVVKEIAPILTPEQQAKARQLVVEARAHMDSFIAKRK
jgi:Spy/CpxP family protein refolding chaperone